MSKKSIPIKRVRTEIETLEQRYKSLTQKIDNLTRLREQAIKKALDVKGQHTALHKLLE